MIEKRGKCADCGIAFVAPNERGPPPKRCAQCRTPQKVARTVRRVKERATRAPIDEYLDGGDGGDTGGPDDGEDKEPRMVLVLRLASYLAHYSEEVAVGFLGLEPSDDTSALIADAKRHFPEVVKNAPGSLQTVVLAGALQSFHTLMTRAQKMSGPAASQAFKSAMQALDAIQSSAAASYTSIEIKIPGAE